MTPLFTVDQTNEIATKLANQRISQVDEETGEVVPFETVDATLLADIGNDWANLNEGDRNAWDSQMVALVTDQMMIHKPVKTSDLNFLKNFGDSFTGIIQTNRIRLTNRFQEDDSYDPTPGTTSDNFINHGFSVESQYFMDRNGERIEYSIPEEWFTGAFLDAEGFNSFINLIVLSINDEMELHEDAVNHGLLLTAMGEILYRGQELQKVDLLAEYNKANPDKMITRAEAMALNNDSFLQSTITTIKNHKDIVEDFNTLTNIQGFPSSTNMKLLLNSRYQNALEIVLKSGRYHKELLDLPTSKRVIKWQTLGSAATFEDSSAIKVGFKSGDGTFQNIEQDGIIGFGYDDAALSTYDKQVKTRSQYDAAGLKTNYFVHFSIRTMIDTYENMVIYYIGPDTPETLSAIEAQRANKEETPEGAE